MTELGADSTGTTIDVPGGTTVRLAWAGVTDVGRKRSANEDSYVARAPIFAVADGMGGHSSGDLASAAVVRRLDEGIGEGFVDTALIETALELASDDIDRMADDKAMGVGTTVTGAVLTLVDGAPHFGIFNIGDSRVYSFARNTLTQITVDHSLVQEMVDSGTISKAQAARHPDGNIITRAVGFGAQPTPDLRTVALRPGLRLLICSDGLTGELDERRIRLNLAAGLSTRETANALVDAALAAGGRDNVTVVVVDVLAGGF
jgi:PPM family protein phosphatase